MAKQAVPRRRLQLQSRAARRRAQPHVAASNLSPALDVSTLGRPVLPTCR